MGVFLGLQPKRIERYSVIHSGSTFTAKRNIEKRDARAEEARLRVKQVAHYAARGLKAPKTRCSECVVDMLSDRRLRQRGFSTL